MAILTVFPHCDMHLALNPAAAASIDYRIFRFLGTNGPFTLDDITSTCTTEMLAPHNAVGSRIHSFVTIDPAAKTITANQVGTNLVVFHFPTDNSYIVVRIQVHDTALAWWFGNAKITTALDAAQAHSQPSLHAMFSNDGNGTDRVGDITGHGFVSLSSTDPAIFTVDNTDHGGRLKGLMEGAADLEGSFLAINQSILVGVVDYAKNRDILVPVRAPDIANAAQRHNVLFIGEGFTGADEAKFDRIVAHAADQLFTKPRHEPFATLSGSFNVFKAFTASKDQLITCGFQVTDTAVDGLGKGRPIPDEYQVSDDAAKYSVAELVARVGLPMRGEARNETDLKTLWASQSLNDYDPAKVDAKLVVAWKNSHAPAFLEARDTFFGMRLGGSWADSNSGSGAPAPAPASDNGSAQLQAFVKRAYEFYKVRSVARSIGLDPRRHPPQLMLRGNESRTSALMTFLGGLRLKDAPNDAIGTQWVPTGAFMPSRGLIAMIINEHVDGGTNIGDHTVTANNIQRDLALKATVLANANPDIKLMRRTVPASFDADLNATTNTIVHEFGHSFNLGDEYEEFREYPGFRNDMLNPGDTQNNPFDGYDNIASLEAIFNDPSYLTNNSRKIDPNKLKWRVLPRIKLSARVTAAVQLVSGKVEAIIASRETEPWEAARVAAEEVHLRRIDIAPNGKQLPLSTADTDHVTGLVIDSVDPATGKIVMTGSAPLSPPLNFPIGSALFVPHRAGGTVVTVIDARVFTELNTSHDPLNQDTDTTKISKEPDYPRAIGGFKPPCKSARLIGIYEGASTWTGLVYRPSGICKMRTSDGADGDSAFCHVCKWLITNRVDPGKHHEVDGKFYPEAKKNG